jgi:hypothetical protein
MPSGPQARGSSAAQADEDEARRRPRRLEYDAIHGGKH